MTLLLNTAEICQLNNDEARLRERIEEINDHKIKSLIK